MDFSKRDQCSIRSIQQIMFLCRHDFTLDLFQRLHSEYEFVYMPLAVALDIRVDFK